MSRLLRLPDVKAITGLSKSSVYGLMAEGRFPPSRKITPRIAVWVAAEVEAWVKAVANGNQTATVA
ncbi:MULTISPECIES: AlpA family phage regulatory protein [Stenotrophomonas]|uniref:helix-turn-helix transcriptional regulator n=1 Tax=Stenotrophomonas TaxID=40323 RepID=UPI000C1546AD|nr:MULTISPECIES: AlpA family phage regulatory protein [Stenotrophomonas]MDI9275001.1 AlpA family transcriptional regulator [Stenotrophomonas sp. PFBMAA-4]